MYDFATMNKLVKQLWVLVLLKIHLHCEPQKYSKYGAIGVLDKGQMYIFLVYNKCK